jgi:NADP-dependent aldehyde dehydrogenase
VVLLEGAETEKFIEAAKAQYAAAPVGTLLNEGVATGLTRAVNTLVAAGAEVVTGGTAGGGAGYCFANTLLRVSAALFLAKGHALQTEAFGNSSLIVVAKNIDEVERVLASLEGNLTGSIYSDRQGADDAAYARIAPVLREKVGRLLNDKMPTGVAVSPAMNHGGPFPATTQPHFTAVGFPAAMRRFTALGCYDNVRESRLPRALQNKNPNGAAWRQIDGHWTRADVAN